MLDVIWILIASALVMIMQLGFLCLETGLVRSKNSINIAVKNILDFCFAGILFWLFGFGMMFGKSFHGLIGISHFSFQDVENYWLIAFLVFQLVFCGTASTIVSGAVAERIKFKTYIYITVIISGIVYPVFGHWAWGGIIEGTGQGWLAKIGFIDFAGSTVVHSVGAWTALASICVIGPRIGAFDDKKRPIQGHNIPLAAAGTLILWFAWFGFNGGSLLKASTEVPFIILNTNLAAISGGLTALFTSISLSKRSNATYIMNGVIAGLVGITAACHMVTPMIAVLIGAVSGLIATLGSSVLRHYKIDDAIGAVSAHGFAGAWGTLAVCLGNTDNFLNGITRLEQFYVQLTGVFVAFAWTFTLVFCLLKLIQYFSPLRVPPENEAIGLNISEHGAYTELNTLMSEMEKQRLNNDFSSKVSIEPHTEVGHIANQYNRVIDAIQNEMEAKEDALKQANESKKKVEIASKTKDQFLANMSHEIRTPMNGVIGMLELLKDEEAPLNTEQLSFVETATNSANDLLVIINDILDLSKIEAEKLQLERLAFHISEVVEDSMKLLAEQAHAKELKLYCWIYPDVPTNFIGDPTRIRQILINLISNAIKFTEKGHISVCISKISINEQLCRLHISVDDTGIGIPEDKQRDLFQAFEQADSSTTRKYGGSGLGLSISQKLVQLMNGKIGIESQLSKGSSFWFELDLTLDSKQEKESLIELPAYTDNMLIPILSNDLCFYNSTDNILKRLGFRTLQIEHISQFWSLLQDKTHINNIPCNIIDMNFLELSDNSKLLNFLNNSLQKSSIYILVCKYLSKLDQSIKTHPRLCSSIQKPALPRTLRNAIKETIQKEKIPEKAKTIQSTFENPQDMKILLVDDVKVNRLVLEKLLLKQGYPCRSFAENGEEAIELLRREDFDLVFMDCQMPVMDGYEATRLLRNKDSRVKNPNIPIIALTAHALSGSKEKCLEAGMDAYLSKPIQIDKLKEVLNHFSKASLATEKIEACL